MLQPYQLQELLSQEKPLVLDVRSSEEFVGELGRIKGSLSIPLPELSSRLGELAPHRKQTLVTV